MIARARYVGEETKVYGRTRGVLRMNGRRLGRGLGKRRKKTLEKGVSKDKENRRDAPSSLEEKHVEVDYCCSTVAT